MQRKYLLLLFLLVGLATQVYATCIVTDDIGKQIHLTKPAQRIISLAPDLTENLFAIGAGQFVKGVIEGSDFPIEAQKILSVGSFTGIDLERILFLHPDLIVTWSNTFSLQLAFFKQLNIPIYTANPHQLEDIPHTLNNLGCLTGNTLQAAHEAQIFSHRLTALSQQYAARKKITVFYQIGNYSLITINKNSWINQVITLCGGQNVFANAATIAPEISWESVVVANPQVIISDMTTANWKKSWLSWPEIRAVQHHFLFNIPPDLMERASPRLLNGASQLCQYLEMAR
ncbi:MAG: cobalamin-binding protein [Gammaproteobacteria bacterium]|nr:cobalamin-binding protein [Gammaproteobacteria bacterium]